MIIGKREVYVIKDIKKEEFNKKQRKTLSEIRDMNKVQQTIYKYKEKFVFMFNHSIGGD